MISSFLSYSQCCDKEAVVSCCLVDINTGRFHGRSELEPESTGLSAWFATFLAYHTASEQERKSLVVAVLEDFFFQLYYHGVQLLVKLEVVLRLVWY